MFRKNMYYQNIYTNTRYPRFFPNFNKTTFNNIYTNDINNSKEFVNEISDDVQDLETKNIDKDEQLKDSRSNNNPKSKFRISSNNISILGFDIAIDDLIIIALILLIFLESGSDYNIIIVLGLILFNISLSNLNFGI
jgi:hypothetical protein